MPNLRIFAKAKLGTIFFVFRFILLNSYDLLHSRRMATVKYCTAPWTIVLRLLLEFTCEKILTFVKKYLKTEIRIKKNYFIYTSVYNEYSRKEIAMAEGASAAVSSGSSMGTTGYSAAAVIAANPEGSKAHMFEVERVPELTKAQKDISLFV